MAAVYVCDCCAHTQQEGMRVSVCICGCRYEGFDICGVVGNWDGLVGAQV
jgi:hypothetical protein